METESLTKEQQDRRSELSAIAAKAVREVFAYREEILKAFVAKYGCGPDEVEQVEQRNADGTWEWCVRRKSSVVPVGHARLYTVTARNTLPMPIPEGWVEAYFYRGDYVDCTVYSKQGSLNETDIRLVELYGNIHTDWPRNAKF